MKIVVVGNCQARPVSQILGKKTGAEMLEPIVLHLASTEDETQNEATLAKADLILAQRTDANFRPPLLASAKLVAQYPDKTLVWPNIFYSGQHPFLRYVTTAGGHRLMGPLDAYHDLRILNRWAKTRGVGPLADYDEKTIQEKIHAASLAAMRQRETDCAVKIADFIESDYQDRRLFFTFNHPTQWLLEHLCDRLCAIADIPIRFPLQGKTEHLGRFVVPSVWQTWPRSNLPLRGPYVSHDPGPSIGVKGLRTYTFEELKQSFFDCYDHVKSLLVRETVRLTPSYEL